MSKSIQHTLFFPHPAETVWEFLTTSELMAQWLMPNDFQPILGQDFQFRIRQMPEMDFDGNVYCKVLEIVPCKKLCYSWKLGPGVGQINVDSVVTWTLTEKNDGTELALLHTGFKETVNVKLYDGMTAGWLGNMKKIAQLANDAKHDAAKV
jgi:uncharacterized protein YndB with AHSA1/START domain